MKRTTDVPIDRREKVFRRQDPMSCRFCRSKKLKCDRQMPCSNCTSRRLPCVSAIEGTVRSHPQQEARDSSPTATSTDFRSDDIAQRLRRLEEAFFSKKTAEADPAQERAGQNCSRASASQIQSNDQVAPELRENASVYSRSSPSPKDFEASNETEAAAKSMRMNTEEYLLLGTSPSVDKPLSVATISGLLPSLAAARTLFTFYVDNLNWTQHIIHVPTTRHELEALYSRLQNSVRPECSQISLIVTILAIAVYFWPDTPIGKATCPVEDRKAHCRKWIWLVERAWVEANHLTSPTIEILQAKLLLTQFLPTYPQSTGRAGHLALLISQAYILQLHRLDSPRQCKARAATTEEAIKLEIQRRVWWTIVIHDWMFFSYINRGQLGTYLVNPDHMIVRYPSNVDDEGIDANSNYDQPFLGPPTEMTFLIVKIHITKIVREFTDLANKAELVADEVDYGLIMTFDKQINDVYNALPPYMRCNATDQSYLHALFKERPYLERQRRLLLFGLHNSLALLHRPFLALSYRDPRYTYSRIVCLRSTRIVIEMQDTIRQSFLGRSWLVIYHVFVAATTLTMDYVYNRDNPHVAAERKREVLKCYRILEECGAQDPEVKHGLESLKRVMQERRVLSDHPQPSLQDRSSLEELLSADAQPWPLPDSDPGVLPTQFRQRPAQAAPDVAADGTQWPRKDSMASWAPNATSQVTHPPPANNVMSERLAWSASLPPTWTNLGNMPLASEQTTAMNGSSGSGLAGAEFSTAAAPWTEPSPELWLPCLDANGDVASEFEWEEVFRDLGTQQFMTGF